MLASKYMLQPKHRKFERIQPLAALTATILNPFRDLLQDALFQGVVQALIAQIVWQADRQAPTLCR